MLGNANVRLNQWQQKRFSEYLTEVGRLTLKAGIPTDKHLFPDQFHKMIQSEHEHSGTNSKLIATPSKPLAICCQYNWLQKALSIYSSESNRPTILGKTKMVLPIGTQLPKCSRIQFDQSHPQATSPKYRDGQSQLTTTFLCFRT